MKKKIASLSVCMAAALILMAVGVLTAGAEPAPVESAPPVSRTESAVETVTSSPETSAPSQSEEPPEPAEDPVPADFTGWRQWKKGGWSYFRSGQKATGWLQLNGVWYFLGGDGMMRTGWAWNNGHWYYLSGSGTMKTGWVKTGGKWYYLAPSGRMLTGFIHDGRDWYYLDSSGAWVEDYADAEVTSGGRKIQIIDGVAYVDGILIANKKYPLPKDYAPGKLDDTVQAALAEMQKAAARDGLSLYVVSGYRSYDYQGQLYRNYCARDGQAAADRYSARPGYSEHQTGLAFDLNSTSNSFAGTPEAKWIAAHAQEYGFIVRYPQGKESLTGYQYEPWHLRYLGKELAKAVYDSGLCLEEYLGIASYYLK